jgi:hypothetical protein
MNWEEYWPQVEPHVDFLDVHLYEPDRAPDDSHGYRRCVKKRPNGTWLRCDVSVEDDLYFIPSRLGFCAHSVVFRAGAILRTGSSRS